MSRLSALLAECEARGVKLRPTPGGGLNADGPRETLTPELLNQLEAYKAEILALLTPSPKRACRCGASSWRDVVLHHAPHNGTTTRRDCAKCNRFLEFPVWYGKRLGEALTVSPLRAPGGGAQSGAQSGAQEAQKAAQQAPAENCTAPRETQKARENPSLLQPPANPCGCLPPIRVPPVGFEHSANSSEKQGVVDQGGAKSGALSARP